MSKRGTPQPLSPLTLVQLRNPEDVVETEETQRRVWLVQHDESGRVLGVLGSAQDAKDFVGDISPYYPEGVITYSVHIGYRFDQRPGTRVFGPGRA